jgi:hypothetical protein
MGMRRGRAALIAAVLTVLGACTGRGGTPETGAVTPSASPAGPIDTQPSLVVSTPDPGFAHNGLPYVSGAALLDSCGGTLSCELPPIPIVGRILVTPLDGRPPLSARLDDQGNFYVTVGTAGHYGFTIVPDPGAGNQGQCPAPRDVSVPFPGLELDFYCE